MSAQLHLTWADVSAAVADTLAYRAPPGATSIYGVPRGGVPVALMVAALTGLRLADEPTAGTWVVDDLVDSGATLGRYDATWPVDALYRKPHSPPHLAPNARELDGWLVFPWETPAEAAGPADAVVRLLEHVGEDPNREGLVDTPGRVLRALEEMCEGYAVDPALLLDTTFDEPYDEMVVVRGVAFTSLCEHHMLPFSGTCTLGYLPTGRVVGLSKLARLVECYARRLQVQERMTSQIAQALMDHLAPLGVGVVVQAVHSCMACRGVRKRGTMVTSAMLGALRDVPEARAEFLALAQQGDC